MGGGLEDVGPDEVHEVGECVLAAEAEHAERHVLDGRARRLPVHQVAEEKTHEMQIQSKIILARN